MGEREELLDIFLTECKEYIDLLDEKIVKLETDPDDRPLLDEIFRAFHTMKGNAGIVGMDRFGTLAHITEEVLAEIRDGKREINSEVINFLLDSLDQLKILHGKISETGNDAFDLDDAPVRSEENKSPAPLSQKAIETEQDLKPTRKKSSTGPAKTKKPVGRKTPAAPQAAAEANGDQTASSKGVDRESAESKTQARKKKSTTSVSDPLLPKAADTKPTDVSGQWNKNESSIRVDVSVLDKLMNSVGELVLARNQIMQCASSFDSGMQAACQRLNMCTSELQEGVMKTRMQPISIVFSRFPRLVRDLTRSTHKKVTLKLEGEETELDKTIIENIRDPLTHLVRNAIDHGIEDEATRSRAGKDVWGSLSLRAYHEGGQVNLEIRDDGAGIDPDQLREKAVAKGLLTLQQAEALSVRDAYNLIFRPGFSTSEKVTSISGRGVGMDVVKTNIEKIGGSVEVISEVGRGTTIKLRIPLTLAIIPALLVTSGGQRFAIPQINLLELVRLKNEDLRRIEHLGNAEVYRLRDKLLPLLRLDSMLKLESSNNQQSDSVSMVVLAADETPFGIIVDKIHDTEEIVVKPLDKLLKEIHCFAGATVMGDGKVSLILDVVGLAETAKMVLGENQRKQKTVDKKGRMHRKQSFLLFSLNTEEQYAMPLSLVSRLETFPVSALQHAGNHEVLEYRGRILPLIRLQKALKLNTVNQPESFSVAVISIEQQKVGFIVGKIIDIVETESAIDASSLQQAGLLGSAIIESNITLIIDAYSLIAGQFPSWFAGKSRLSPSLQDNRISNILIVDDSPFLRAIERSYLEPEGFHIVEACNGNEALERLQSEEIDLIITDIDMPEMNGLELTRAIRAHESYQGMPIVALSSLGSHKDVTIVKEAGVDAYIDKLDREELLSSVEEVMSC
ncbi:MAG: chemotaxis protein CheW [bacterium]